MSVGDGDHLYCEEVYRLIIMYSDCPYVVVCYVVVVVCSSGYLEVAMVV